jgi:hypothetical protein
MISRLDQSDPARYTIGLALVIVVAAGLTLWFLTTALSDVSLAAPGAPDLGHRWHA